MSTAILRRRIFSHPSMAIACACIALGASVAGAQAVAPAGASKDAAVAQDASPSALTFDVVSIKPYGPNDMMIRVQGSADGVSVTGMPMHMILREAFGTTNDRLLGEPGWVNANRYNVDAKVASEDAQKFKALTFRQQWAMLLPPLVDRCKLTFHHETRELTVYTLVVAKGGVKMQPAKPDDNASGPGPGAGPPPPPPPPQGRAPGPGRMTMGVGDGGMTMFMRASSTEQIATMISRTIGSTVIDKTGLTGKYDCTLQFAPDENMRAGMPPAPGGGGPPPESQGPSIFAAVQEQLGLKLEAHKEPVDVIVIDHMEEPAEN